MASGLATIHRAQALQRKHALVKKLKELAGLTDAFEEMRIENVADPLDQVRSSSDREMAVQHVEHRSRLATDIRAALSKIEGSEYGICEGCEEPIASKRLDVLPWARLCVRCQSEIEETDHHDYATFEPAA